MIWIKSKFKVLGFKYTGKVEETKVVITSCKSKKDI